MKTGTEGKLKYRALKMQLRIPTYQVTGVLESLWQMACKDAPDGDIGKHSNAMIAAGMEWSDDPDKLIQALVDTGWIDEVEDARRLVIHDWEDHCPEYIKKRKRAQKSAEKRSSAQKSAEVEKSTSVCAIVKSSQVKPSQVKEESAQPDGSEPAQKIPKPEILDELIDSWNTLGKSIAPSVESRRSDPIIKGWKRVRRVPEARKAFDDIPTLMARIRDGTLLHGQGWFRFTWLFATGKTGEWNVLKILDRRYEQNDTTERRRDTGRVTDEASRDGLKFLK